MIIMIPKNMMNTFRETIFTTHIDLKPTMLPWQQNVGKFMVSNNLFSQKNSIFGVSLGFKYDVFP